MAELKLETVEIHQVIEQGYIGRPNPVHGTFSTREEAERRFQEVLQRQPGLGATGSLGVYRRRVEAVRITHDFPETEHIEPVAKMRRRGAGGYEDKQLEPVERGAER